MGGRYVDRLARLLFIAALLSIAVLVVKGISPVLLYIIGAAVLSLVGRPLKNLIDKIRIARWRMPSWLSSVLTLIILLSAFLGVISLMVPTFSSIASDISKANVERAPSSLVQPLESLNGYLRETFSFLGEDFSIQKFVVEKMSALLNVSMVSSVITGVAGFVADFGIAIFAMVFIAFFFLKDRTLFPKIVAACVPDRLEAKTHESISEINSLMSRYFSGLVLEVIGVALLNFLWLLLIGRMGFKYSIGIAFITGLLNIIPYVGPLIGEILGVTLAVIIKYACAGHFGPDVSVWVFILIILACLLATQMVDNFFFQPLIYSSSVKAHPLEIFIVLLLAGHFGGILAMLMAIPAYTVLRVVASKFFTNFKPVRRLTAAERETQNPAI